jgi:hypothetical protein
LDMCECGFHYPCSRWIAWNADGGHVPGRSYWPLLCYTLVRGARWTHSTPSGECLKKFPGSADCRWVELQPTGRLDPTDLSSGERAGFHTAERAPPRPRVQSVGSQQSRSQPVNSSSPHRFMPSNTHLPGRRWGSDVPTPNTTPTITRGPQLKQQTATNPPLPPRPYNEQHGSGLAARCRPALRMVDDECSSGLPEGPRGDLGNTSGEKGAGGRWRKFMVSLAVTHTVLASSINKGEVAALGHGGDIFGG